MTAFFQRNLKRLYPTVKRAEGCWIEDTTGKRYLDGCSGAVAANIGHNVAEINDAIAAQLRLVAFAHTSQFLSEPALSLAEKLISIAPPNFAGGRVFFATGGSEAVESAIKLARAYFVEEDRDTTRYKIIARWNSYHGGTLGALSATGHPARRKPYLPLLADFPHIAPAYPYRCPCGFKPGACPSDTCAESAADELERAILQCGAKTVAAFIAEPIVGAALGAVAPRHSYWRRIREICDRHGVLLIADEVMTGLGRCGAAFAMDHFAVQPDVIVAGKGLAAGYMPLSAVLVSAKVIEPFLKTNSSGAFEHGFTYSGHPLSCAAGLAVFEYIQANRLIHHVALRADTFMQLMQETRAFDFVGDVRFTGFFGGIEFVANRQTKEPFPSHLQVNRLVTQSAADNGLLVYPGSAFVNGERGDHIIIAPPLNISDEELAELFARLKSALSAVQDKLAASAANV